MRAQARWLLVISGIFTLSVSLSNTFVNVYLWKVDQNYGAVGWYNLAVYCGMPLTFIAAGWIAKRYHSALTLRAGIGLHAVFYLIAVTAGERAARWPIAFGALMGVAGGFYWLSFNQLSLRSTEAGSRERFYGMNGVLAAVAGMMAPPVAGYLIARGDRFGGLTGYHLIFGLSLALFVLSMLVSLKLRAARSGGRLDLGTGVRALRSVPWRMTLLGCSFYGLREGVFLFLIGLLMYIASGSELKLGEFVLLQSGLSFASFFVVSRLVNPDRRLAAMGIGAVAMAMAALLFLFPLRPLYIVWYGALIALALPLFLVPLQGYVFDGIGRLRTAKTHHIEHIIVREIFENAGRVAGIGAFIALVSVQPSATAISRLAVTLGFVQLVTWLLIRVGQQWREPTGDAGRAGIPQGTRGRRRNARARGS